MRGTALSVWAFGGAFVALAGVAVGQPTRILDDFDGDNSDELLGTQGLIAVVGSDDIPTLQAADGFLTAGDVGAVVYQDEFGTENLVVGQWPNDQGAGVELGLDFEELEIIGFEFDFVNNAGAMPFGVTLFDGGPSGTPERRIAVWDALVEPGVSTVSTLFSDVEWNIEVGFEFTDIGSIFYGLNNNPRTPFGSPPVDVVDIEFLEFRAILVPSPGVFAVGLLCGPLVVRRRR